MTAIDETDQRILTMLEADGRATLAQLAQATGLSVSAAQSRVQKLEKRGIIKGYKAIIDQEQRGLPISAFVNVTPLDYSAESSIPDKLNNIDGTWNQRTAEMQQKVAQRDGVINGLKEENQKLKNELKR